MGCLTGLKSHIHPLELPDRETTILVRLTDSTPDFSSVFSHEAFAKNSNHKAVALFAHSWEFDSWAPGHIHTPMGHACRTLGVKPPPDFSSGFTPEAFTPPGANHKAVALFNP